MGDTVPLLPPLPPPQVIILPGASRKQNVACDACRSKKIKCQRETVNQRCAQCVGRNADCTSNYIEQLQAKQKKGRKRGDDEPVTLMGKRRRSEVDGDVSADVGISRAMPILPQRKSSSSNEVSRHDRGGPSRPGPSRRRSASEKQLDLLRYLFAPEPVMHHEWGYSDDSSLDLARRGLCDMFEEQGGRVWEEEPSEAHLAIPDAGLAELAEDLVDTFFSVAHIRFPTLDPLLFRDRYAAPDTHPSRSIGHAMLAIAIAFGSRFSDNPVLAADREEMTERDDEDGRGRGRSRCRISQMLLIRAREVAMSNKLDRIPCLESIQALAILEHALGQESFVKKRFHGHHAPHLGAAARHIRALGWNTSAGIFAIKDERERTSATYAWFLVSLPDVWRSAFNRANPCFLEDDSDIEAPQTPPSSQGPMSALGTESTADQSVLWLSCAVAGSVTLRKFCNVVSKPRAPAVGLPLSLLRDLIHSNSTMRDLYISRLGVPSTWRESWDFLAAVTAVGVDMYFHSIWLMVWRAIMDFGIAEERAGAGTDEAGIRMEIESVRKRYEDEGDHAALRIAALTAVLTEHGYLRLDPGILYQSIHAAGIHLASEGRDECRGCTAGLRQYSLAYGHMWDLADDIEARYAARIAVPAAAPEQSALPPMQMRPLTTVDIGLGQPGEPIQPMIGHHEVFVPADRTHTGTTGSTTATMATTGSSTAVGVGMNQFVSPEGMSKAWGLFDPGVHGAFPLPINGDDALPPTPSRDVPITLYEWLQQV